MRSLRIFFLLCLFFILFQTKSFAAVNYVKSFTQGSQPSGVTVFNGVLYVTDNIDSSLYTFSLNGTFLNTYSGYMSPMGISSLNGKLYTSNTDTDGVLSTVPGNPPVSFASGLDGPWGVSAHNNHIFAVSTNGDYVTEFNEAGSVINTFGNSVLIDPASIAFDSSGRAYVTNFNTGEITRFSSDFSTSSTWVSGLGNPFGIAIDQYNFVYISDNTDNVVYKYDINGNLLTTIGSSGSDPGEFNAPLGVYVDNHGNIYVADSGNGRVEQFFDTNFPQPTPTPGGGGDSGGNSGSSGLPSCTSLSPIGSPDLFRVVSGINNATLYFAPVSGQNTGYIISYGTSQTANQFATTFNYGVSPGAISYTINYLYPGTWYFKVSGINNCMPGTWSQSVSTNIRI